VYDNCKIYLLAYCAGHLARSRRLICKIRKSSSH